MDHPIAFFALVAAAIALAITAWRIRLTAPSTAFLGVGGDGEERPVATVITKACLASAAAWLVYVACSLQGWAR